MAYSIIELQTDINGNTSTPPLRTETDLNQARSVYHSVSSSAAISSVYLHVVLLLDERGHQIERSESVHAPAPVPVTE